MTVEQRHAKTYYTIGYHGKADEGNEKEQKLQAYFVGEGESGVKEDESQGGVQRFGPAKPGAVELVQAGGPD
jgi:hypothetical protein